MVNNEKKVVNNENQEILTKTVVGLGIPAKERENLPGGWQAFLLCSVVNCTLPPGRRWWVSLGGHRCSNPPTNKYT